MAYGLSNGHAIDDVTWPWKVKLVTPKRLERNISKTAGFSFHRLHSKGPPIGNDMESNGHVTDDVTWPQGCCEAVWSAILATAWLLVIEPTQLCESLADLAELQQRSTLLQPNHDSQPKRTSITGVETSIIANVEKALITTYASSGSAA